MQTQQKKIQLIQRKMLNSQPEQKTVMIQEDRSVQAVRIIKEWRYILCTLFSYCTGEIFQEESLCL